MPWIVRPIVGTGSCVKPRFEYECTGGKLNMSPIAKSKGGCIMNLTYLRFCTSIMDVDCLWQLAIGDSSLVKWLFLGSDLSAGPHTSAWRFSVVKVNCLPSTVSLWDYHKGKTGGLATKRGPKENVY